MPVQNHKPAGFILLEVLLSLIVLTGAVVVVFHMYRMSLFMSQKGPLLDRAIFLLQERLEESEKTGVLQTDPSEDPFLGTISWSSGRAAGPGPSGHLRRLSMRWGKGNQHLELYSPEAD